MAIYKPKKSLTIAPALFLFALGTITLFIKPEAGLLICVLCIILGLLFLCFYLFVDIETSKKHIKEPKIRRKNVQWDKIFEVVISKKSAMSGYVFQTVSYLNEKNEKDYFVAGSWFANSEQFIEELKQNAVNAEIIDQRT